MQPPEIEGRSRASGAGVRGSPAALFALELGYKSGYVARLRGVRRNPKRR